MLENIDDRSQILPKCYSFSGDNYSFLVFEDLANRNNYQTSHKRSGLTVKQLKLVLTKVAKWHAATAVLEPIVRNHNIY